MMTTIIADMIPPIAPGDIRLFVFNFAAFLKSERDSGFKEGILGREMEGILGIESRLIEGRLGRLGIESGKSDGMLGDDRTVGVGKSTSNLFPIL